MSTNSKMAGLNERKNNDLSALINDYADYMQGLEQRFNEAIKRLATDETAQPDEEEKAILLDLSTEIAAARNRESLFDTVHSKLAAFFDIEGLTLIFTGSEERIFEIHAFEKVRTAGQVQLGTYTTKVPDTILGHILRDLTMVSGSLCFETALYASRFPEVDFFNTWLSKGWRNFAIVSLQVSEEVLGYLLLHMFPQTVSSLRTNLLKGVSAQLSVGLSNINRIEETLRRKSEMELLLVINTGLASVRGAEELADFIRNTFKKLFGCSHTMIAVCNEDGLTLDAFLLDEDAKAKIRVSHLSFRDCPNRPDDAVLGLARSTNMPLVFDLHELAAQDNPPLYVTINDDLQQKALLVIRLAKADDVVGFWFIYFRDKQIITAEKMTLIQSLSHQLCISVANISANLEIKKRESEKERLLKFSNAIAPVRDKVTLSQILKTQLFELFGIENYVIHTFDPGKKAGFPLLFSDDTGDGSGQDTGLASLKVFPDGLLDGISPADGPVSYTVGADGVSLLDDRLAERPGTSRVAMVISLGSDGIAVLNFVHPDFRKIKQQEALMRSICSQISIAVSNIIANETVNQQLVEIRRYKQQLEEETIYLKEEIKVNQNYSEIIGDSQAIHKTFHLVAQVAPSDTTVLILGETGTGKELVARAIHNNSPRKSKLMVKVNCAALPANLIESELFGHERGSFTGATDKRVGKFELANNGTLFLDEIGEMPLELQVKLLRALQEKEIERVGGRGTIKVDVRIIAATNRDLEKEVDAGRFRGDLYYRLNVFPIELAALRDRKEDIPVLAAHFIQLYSKKTGRQITTLGSRALQEMMQYSWPGNIRELEHLVERSILLTTGRTLKQIHLPTNKVVPAAIDGSADGSLKTIDENERDHILKVLKHCQGRISGAGGAAAILGVPPSTLNSRMKRLGIKREHFA
ncbi:sigma 54-interacting transcriptional regulator [Flavitalea sp. BT771]|uniref:sigma 54-interacting transcriptional regulator n=1 Tax=Flavitalea sp. BT771 TaxID=3063329 RepID=UPI0026E1FA21|nr:sigma 54-interacting transcriptional regulator [Flavitalea sp. BT771]MDO6431153.1 sigma 54-interacting transcriptional regulator [Flavitalea sp. BT771]MDV6220060.1 sigma 54-interacting transcriptional regulator [Flavitalea sp. BT771]